MWLNIGEVFNSAQQAVRKVIGRDEPSKEALLAKTLFASGPSLPKSPTILSGHSMGSAWVVADYTSLYRATQDLAVEICNCFPTDRLNIFRDFISSKDVSMGYHAFGSASSLNAIIGAVQLKKSLEETEIAKIIGDEQGTLLGRISQVKSGSVALAGLSFGIFRPFSMYGVISDAGAGSLTARVNYGAVQAGLAAYAVFFTALTGILGVQIHEGKGFVQDLDSHGTAEEKLAWLQAQLSPDPEAILTELKEEHGLEKAREVLIDEALETAKGHLSSLMKELGIAKVSEEELLGVVKEAVRQSCSGWTQASVEKQMRQKLMMIGLKVKVAKAQMKQSAKMGRVLGQAGLDAINEVKSLKGRVTKLDTSAENLVETIRTSAKGQITENALVLSICALGVVAMILAMVFTAGTPLLISSAVMLVFSILMMAVDGYYLYQSYKSERPGSQDKNMTVFSTIMGVSSMLTLIILGLTGVVTMGVFPMAVAGVMCALWIGQNAVTYWVMDRNEKRYQLKNPTLETFLKALHTNRDQDKIMEMFGNLPEGLKAMLQRALKDHKQDMKQAALAVAKKVEAAKERRKERLRESLVPLLVKHSPSC